MPGHKSIAFADSALVDLETLRAWYAEQGVPEVGAPLVTEILAEVERLAIYPESGRMVPEFNLPTLRELLHPPFRIVYRIGERHLWIVRVWRSERLLRLPTQGPAHDQQ